MLRKDSLASQPHRKLSRLKSKAKKDCLPRETVPCVAVVVPALMMLPLIALTAPFDRPFINLTLDLGYFDLEIVVHLDRLTLIGS